MASCGFNVKNEENEANELLFQGGDWSFGGEPGDEPEDMELGSSWDLPVDRMVDVYLSVSSRPNERNPEEPFEDQEFSAWAPVGDRVEL